MSVVTLLCCRESTDMYFLRIMTAVSADGCANAQVVHSHEVALTGLMMLNIKKLDSICYQTLHSN